MKKTLIAIMAIGGFLVALWFASILQLPMRYGGQWIIATTMPQICWVPTSNVDGTYSATGTGWSKMPGKDVWYRVLGRPTRGVTVAELQVQGHVCYPGETAEQCGRRRAFEEDG